LNKETDLFDSIRLLSESSSDRRQFEADIQKKHGTRCAMLVLDSTGFTRSTQESGILKYLECIVRMRDILKQLLAESECISWRFSTDNAYAEFSTAEDAVKAAIEIQKSVREANIMIDDRNRFGVCIGIGFGDVLRSSREGVFGDEMNLASKLGEDLAGDGEILITESVYNSIPGKYRIRTIKRIEAVSGIELAYHIVVK
jgi:adenylate cyclase